MLLSHLLSGHVYLVPVEGPVEHDSEGRLGGGLQGEQGQVVVHHKGLHHRVRVGDREGSLQLQIFAKHYQSPIT